MLKIIVTTPESMTPSDKYYYYLHVTDKKAKAQVFNHKSL